MRKNLLVTFVYCSVIFITSCNKSEPEAQQEDYNSIFQLKDPEQPYVNYEDMIVTSCNPSLKDEDFIYPGVDIEGTKREYEVKLSVNFREQKFYKKADPSYAQFEVKYINADKQLIVLRNYEFNGLEGTLKNFERFNTSFKVLSGYPLYLVVTGYGFNQFDIFVDLTAKSVDGLIEAPKISYRKFLNKDGSVELEPFGQKVILP